MHERIPVQIWSPSDLRALRWGSILLGVGVGVFLPRALRHYGRWIALGSAVLAIKPLMAMLREDTVVCSDRPLEAEHAETLTLDSDASAASPSAV
jgi:hypothetical protein